MGKKPFKNFVGKEENVGYHHFLLLPQYNYDQKRLSWDC